MRKLVSLRPSPAMIVALISLFVALSGTVYATSKISGSQIKRNSIPGNRLKNASVTGQQINSSTLGMVPNANNANTANTASTANNANALGGSGPDAYQQRVRWAIVDASGNITAQSGGITMELHNGGPCPAGVNNCDILNFGSSQANKAITVTPNQLSTALSAWHCGGTSSAGGTTCPVGDDVNHVQVKPFDSATGNPENARYFIAVIG